MGFKFLAFVVLIKKKKFLAFIVTSSQSNNTLPLSSIPNNIVGIFWIQGVLYGSVGFGCGIIGQGIANMIMNAKRYAFIRITPISVSDSLSCSNFVAYSYPIWICRYNTIMLCINRNVIRNDWLGLFFSHLIYTIYWCTDGFLSLSLRFHVNIWHEQAAICKLHLHVAFFFSHLVCSRLFL